MRGVFLLLSVLSITSCLAKDVSPDRSRTVAKLSTVDSDLFSLLADYRAFQRDNSSQKPFKSKVPGMPIFGDDVIIDAVAAHDGASLKKRLRELGATNLSVFGRNVSCHFPIGQIDKLARLSDLKFARPSIATTRPATN